VQRLAVEDLRAKMNRNEVTVVDVRDAASFRSKHIAGAINIPFASIETMLDQIPKDKPVVTYCS
jgi:rhodanese-related sulfurtransferase